MSNIPKAVTSNTQIYIFIISALTVLCALLAFCANCHKNQKSHRSSRRHRSKSSNHNRPSSFSDVPLPSARDRSLSAFLATTQEQLKEEPSIVKNALFGLVTEQFDEPTPYPRTVDMAARKSLANIHKNVNFHQTTSNDVERQYQTINASYKYSPSREKSLDIIYANFEALSLEQKKKNSFGSEQGISTKGVEEKPPALLQRFVVHKSVDELRTGNSELTAENKEKPKTKPYEHLHITDSKKPKNSYENHEIISKNRGFVCPV